MLVAAGVGTSCGAPVALLEVAGGSDGADNAIGTGAFGKLMASWSETAEGVGAGMPGEAAGSAGVRTDWTARAAGCAGAVLGVVPMVSLRLPAVLFVGGTSSAGVLVELCSLFALPSTQSDGCGVGEMWELGFFRS
jgi:hypothetical protein